MPPNFILCRKISRCLTFLFLFPCRREKAARQARARICHRRPSTAARHPQRSHLKASGDEQAIGARREPPPSEPAARSSCGRSHRPLDRIAVGDSTTIVVAECGKDDRAANWFGATPCRRATKLTVSGLKVCSTIRTFSEASPALAPLDRRDDLYPAATTWPFHRDEGTLCRV